MIIVKLMGGLGNQMSQYALGRKIAIRHNTELKLDISGYRRYKLHSYQLNNFNIIENIASDREVKSYKSYLKNPFNFFIPYYKRTYIKERGTHPIFPYDPNICEINENVYLQGYWSSEKYYRDIKNILRQEFTPKDYHDLENTDILNQIKNTESVSIHFRRGDYITNPAIYCLHLSYYHEALWEIKKYIPDPYFFIFSDEIDWVKQNFNISYPFSYVEEIKPENALYLMSLCKHHIIANSSFSWWGAWLSSYPRKIIIAPKRWVYGDIPLNPDSLPEEWIRV